VPAVPVALVALAQVLVALAALEVPMALVADLL
jgi:hypothetical protein